VRLLRPLAKKNGLRKPDPFAGHPQAEGSSSATTGGMVPSFPAEGKRSSLFHSCATQKSKAGPTPDNEISELNGFGADARTEAICSDNLFVPTYGIQAMLGLVPAFMAN
jgi:hypothetical protein